MKIQKQPLLSLFPARQLWPRWNVSGSSPSHQVDILTLRLAHSQTDTHHISWPVRPNSCSSEETTEFGMNPWQSCQEGERQLPAFHITAAGSFFPADIARLWNVIWAAGGGSLEKVSLISPIYHCLLRSATEPPGCGTSSHHELLGSNQLLEEVWIPVLDSTLKYCTEMEIWGTL